MVVPFLGTKTQHVIQVAHPHSFLCPLPRGGGRDEAEVLMGRLLDGIEAKRGMLVAAKEGAERSRKDIRKVSAWSEFGPCEGDGETGVIR